MGKEMNQHIAKKDMANIAYEEVLFIIYQENANQNEISDSHHTSENGMHKKLHTTNIGRNVMNRKLSFTAGRNITWLSLYEK